MIEAALGVRTDLPTLHFKRLYIQRSIATNGQLDVRKSMVGYLIRFLNNERHDILKPGGKLCHKNDGLIGCHHSGR